MDTDLMGKRARVLAMQQDLNESQIEFQKILKELQGACHHESVVELDINDRDEERRICVICGAEEKRYDEDGHLRGSMYEYVQLGAPFAVRRLPAHDFYPYRRLHKLVLVPVPAPEPKVVK